ncbi:hypothetical protein [Listeria newyorkensis]|uniref:hypothetical protein n=1 Tax=Listeria newyorkensis TaxID=1497681 RepID=UPI00051D9B05|nr:hypothetical protein [Listeria newyorkensis]KGL43562.1 hypothetical protein EP58_07425 [Listeria newyorkensis]
MNRKTDYKLFKEVVDNSNSDVWEDAVKEWMIGDCREDDNMLESCVCGKEHLKYLFTIENRENGNVLTPIGSSCIEKFERKDLNEFTKINRKLFELLHAFNRNEYIALDNKYFTRKLLLYLYEQGAFQNSKYSSAKNSYEMLLKMFNKKTEPTPKQKNMIKAIIMSDIRPYLEKILKDKINT